ncbi:hypothetical protein Hanom_Chr12g01156671 [Helianthus anomalus]
MALFYSMSFSVSTRDSSGRISSPLGQILGSGLFYVWFELSGISVQFGSTFRLKFSSISGADGVRVLVQSRIRLFDSVLGFGKSSGSVHLFFSGE